MTRSDLSLYIIYIEHKPGKLKGQKLITQHSFTLKLSVN